MISIADKRLSSPVFLAPLAGITDLPFRNLVAEFGAGLVVSEMIASQEFLHRSRSAKGKAELGREVENTAVQLAGCDAPTMAEAARMAEDHGARFIDINMGCPAKRVTSPGGYGASGSALMRDPDHALRLIEAVVDAVTVPVSLKMRLGWDGNSLNAPELAARAEAVGVAMITIHGRTRIQFYAGRADWRAIAKVRRAVQIPVIANGDIIDAQSARRARDHSGASGLMIGRGARGRPWIVAEIASAVYGAPAPVVPVGLALAELVATHYTHMLGFYGSDLGLRAARKHLGWYMDHVGTEARLRRELLTTCSPQDVLRRLPEAMVDGRSQTGERNAA